MNDKVQIELIPEKKKPAKKFDWILQWRQNSEALITAYLSEDSVGVLDKLSVASDLTDQYISTRRKSYGSDDESDLASDRSNDPEK